MHCDDKRTLFVLKESIEKNWKLLEDSNFKDHQLLENFSKSLTEYFECKSSATDAQ